MALGLVVFAALLVAGLGILGYRHARVARANRHLVESQVSTGETNADRNRYVIQRPNLTSPYTLEGKLAPSMRWKGEGRYFMIWDRRMRRWIDGAFVTRELAEQRLDDLTKSRRAQSKAGPHRVGEGEIEGPSKRS